MIEKQKLNLQKHKQGSAFFETSKNFIIRMGEWVGGWVGGCVGGWMGGDQKSPSIFLIFKYVNKQDALILNLASKVVYDNKIKSYEQFKFENLKF